MRACKLHTYARRMHTRAHTKARISANANANARTRTAHPLNCNFLTLQISPVRNWTVEAIPGSTMNSVVQDVEYGAEVGFYYKVPQGARVVKQVCTHVNMHKAKKKEAKNAIGASILIHTAI